MNLYQLHSEPESLDHHDVAHESVPVLFLKKHKGRPAELKKREAAIATDADASLSYARDMLRGPFPAGEAVITKNAACASQYASRVLRGPFHAGEATIAADAFSATCYAQDLCSKARFR